MILADEAQLPIDPTADAPPRPCDCGNADLRPDTDVMDTWATSSVSPQIAGQMFADPALYARLFPMQLRPQAHDIIRTWAFYTIVKSLFHFEKIPWGTVMISGHALDPSGRKFSKSKGNAAVMPTQLTERHGADAVRYWACDGGLGADQPLNEEAMRQGARLITKLWNASRFIASHLPEQIENAELRIEKDRAAHSQFSIFNSQFLLPTDRALLSWLQRLIARSTASFRAYDYAAAKEATERFFWGTLCDNYLEWVKGRLYDGSGQERRAAQLALAYTLLALLKLLAPIMPHITEEIYQQLFAQQEGAASIHISAWPQADETLIDPQSERTGEALLALTAGVRRWKSARKLGPGAQIAQLKVAAADQELLAALRAAEADLRSVSRAREIYFAAEAGDGSEELAPGLWISVEA
jgi:valyl-tRNA synthetase